jgi:hypothetical protein
MLGYLENEEKTQSLESFDSRLFCPFCLIKKHSKVRHVKKLNLCVKDFHFYSKFYDKIVFGKNAYFYQLTLILNALIVALVIGLTLHAFRVRHQKHFLMFFVEFIEVRMTLFSRLFLIFNFLLLPSLAIDMFIQLICVCRNLTYDELIRPQYYPYLFTNMNGVAHYKNPNDFGLIKNLKIYIRRLI